ncbi:S41 family peptidase [Ekhidna sp.]|uniref:S41 family peptidase n=1 Tax=Ekhidna sp. TaxID=2608089 RepID=UPI003B5A55D3
MNKKFRVLSITVVFMILALAVGCKNDDGINVELQNEVNDFIWFAMYEYYYWVDDVDDLSIEKYPTYDALHTFLNGYNNPINLFDDLLYSPGEVDRFSWIVDDYEELEASFQGISKSFGFEFGLIAISGGNDIFGYVKYVVPASPADNAGIIRGDLFTKVDGVQLTRDNYQALLFGSESYSLTLATIQDNTISDTDQEVSMNAVELSENPILVSEVFKDLGGPKVGYLMYNQFISNNAYHEELNNVFGTFVSEGITDIVLDLRYNGGGSLLTSRILSSMIYGNSTSNDLLGSIVYNERLTNALTANNIDLDITFLDKIPDTNSTINQLNLDRVFILISGSTASASEFVIAGLDPYMDITLIGMQTVGKNVASATLYDSEDYQKSNTLNPNHKYAIQPIISQLANSEGFTDYIDGFVPNISVNELDYLEEGLKPLGDPSEVLLATALDIITAGPARVERIPDSGLRTVFDSQDKDEIQNTILIDYKELPPIHRNYLKDMQ